jgi:hypothetical protein
MKPETDNELSLNAKLAFAFDKQIEIVARSVDDGPWEHNLPDYCNDNLAAFSLLEKAKKDGKINYYHISAGPMHYKVQISMPERYGEGSTLSKAITQALAQLIKELSGSITRALSQLVDHE